jgi:hypothetical protein
VPDVSAGRRSFGEAGIGSGCLVDGRERLDDFCGTAAQRVDTAIGSRAQTGPALAATRPGPEISGIDGNASRRRLATGRARVHRANFRPIVPLQPRRSPVTELLVLLLNGPRSTGTSSGARFTARGPGMA